MNRRKQLRAIRWGGVLIGALLWMVLAGTSHAATLPDKVDFNFHIRPLLSDRCFTCHGPDERGRKGKLRLDTEEGARKLLDEATGLRPFTPRSLEKSEAYQRIITTDEDNLMPPPDSNLHLSADEIALIKRWIEQGAEYQRHWSFTAVKQPEVPKIKGVKGSLNPIDAFILAKLEQKKLKPTGRASKETLIRRVALDLTGTPPSLAEQDAFLADTSPNAYQKMVEQYLNAPAYGERMANEWLDLARYADTYGYQADVEYDMSPWRDWVIRAFNENMRYDDFIQWQIAGDLFPNATREQKLATAFNRLHRQTNEGGSIEEEFRVEYVMDRVHTMGTAMLGLTFECARCHDHKYDPISQKDYYRLTAFFNNIDESGLYSHFTRATPTPVMPLYAGDQEAKHKELRQQVDAAEKRVTQAGKEALPRFEAWAKNAALTVPTPMARFAFEGITSNTIASVIGEAKASLSDDPVLVEGHDGKAIQFSGDNSATIEGAGAFKRTDEFSFSLWLKPTEKQDRAVVFHFSRAWSDSASRGYELILEQGIPQFALIHFWPGNALAVRAKEPLPLNEWTQFTVTYDGSSRAGGVTLYRNGQPLESEVVRDNLYKDIRHLGEWGDSEAGGIRLTLAGRFRDTGFKNGLLDDFNVYDVCLTRDEVAHVHNPSAAPASGETLYKAYLARHDAAYIEAKKSLKVARDAENDFSIGVREIMVMRELDTPRPAYVLNRGAYDARGEEVQADTPNSIFPFPKDLPHNRLGLAKWLVDARNPLTARVVVNRIWRQHFGRGLVVTQEDFGSQGRLPTHPELLDWLAYEFMRSGWDVKALHRLMLTSATYQQSSKTPAELLATDSENLWLARGPKHRLQAEQIRDSALAVSGLLNAEIGGTSVKPYQPAGLWEEAGTGKSYSQDKGDKLYRRSLYTFWRRTAPPPSMLTFDATSREVCTAKRETTATPLQALVLLNDPQFVEAARVLGEHLVRESRTEISPRIITGFRKVLGRQPDTAEQKILQRLYAEQLAWFRAHPEDAAKYLKVGDKPRDESLPADEVAATTVLASALLNHDEFVMKR